jgi:hypothetical protein
VAEIEKEGVRGRGRERQRKGEVEEGRGRGRERQRKGEVEGER